MNAPEPATPTSAPPSGLQVRLSGHGQELVVVEVGGGLRTYHAGGRPVLDGYRADQMCAGGRGQILAPWPNRLAGGSFEWAGREQHTPLSEPERGNAIHGLVRWSAWTAQEDAGEVATGAAGAATLTHRLQPQPGWPWRLDFRIGYRLGPQGLTVRTEVTNASDEPAPFGLGWHPYLQAFGALVDDLTVTVPARTAYMADDRGIPTGRFDVTGTDLDYRSGRTLGPARLDTAFTDLERDDAGRAVVRIAPTGGGSGTRLWMDEAYTHLMVFSGDSLAEGERRRRALAVEPMTGAPNALRSGDGLRTVAPGETFTATWGLQPEWL